MKAIKIISTIALFMPLIACNAQTEPGNVINNSKDRIEAYYFHFTARCMTCRTIEEKAKENIAVLFPDMVSQGKITFQSINLEEASSKELAKRLQISGQTLMLVKGDQKINITNEGFMYAVYEPEKFKAVIKEKIDSLL